MAWGVLFLEFEIKCNSCPAHSLMVSGQSFAFVAADSATTNYHDTTLEATIAAHFAINCCKTNLRCRSEECIHKNLKNWPENLLVTRWKAIKSLCLVRTNCTIEVSWHISKCKRATATHYLKCCATIQAALKYRYTEIQKDTETERRKDSDTEILLILKCKRASTTHNLQALNCSNWTDSKMSILKWSKE